MTSLETNYGISSEVDILVLILNILGAVNSVNFPFTRLLMKLFKTSSIDNINDIQYYFVCQPSKMVERLRIQFSRR